MPPQGGHNRESVVPCCRQGHRSRRHRGRRSLHHRRPPHSRQADARLRADARGRDGCVRKRLAAGIGERRPWLCPLGRAVSRQRRWFLRLLAARASTLGVDVLLVVHLAIRPLDADGLLVYRKQEPAAKAWSNESCELKEEGETFDLMCSFQSAPGAIAPRLLGYCYPERYPRIFLS